MRFEESRLTPFATRSSLSEAARAPSPPSSARLFSKAPGKRARTLDQSSYGPHRSRPSTSGNPKQPLPQDLPCAVDSRTVKMTLFDLIFHGSGSFLSLAFVDSKLIGRSALSRCVRRTGENHETVGQDH